jgi:hypothetical protein
MTMPCHLRLPLAIEAGSESAASVTDDTSTMMHSPLVPHRFHRRLLHSWVTFAGRRGAEGRGDDEQQRCLQRCGGAAAIRGG